MVLAIVGLAALGVSLLLGIERELKRPKGKMGFTEFVASMVWLAVALNFVIGGLS